MRIFRSHHLYGKEGITGYGRTRFFQAVKDGEFPKPNVNLRTEDNPINGWTSDIVFAWIASVRTDNPVTIQDEKE